MRKMLTVTGPQLIIVPGAGSLAESRCLCECVRVRHTVVREGKRQSEKERKREKEIPAVHHKLTVALPRAWVGPVVLGTRVPRVVVLSCVELRG